VGQDPGTARFPAYLVAGVLLCQLQAVQAQLVPLNRHVVAAFGADRLLHERELPMPGARTASGH